MIKNKEDPEFPDLSYRAFLSVDLLSVGPTMSTGMGIVGLSHSELSSWAANIGHEFEGTEAEWLVKMSDAYAAELARSDDMDTPAPFVTIEVLES